MRRADRDLQVGIAATLAGVAGGAALWWAGGGPGLGLFVVAPLIVAATAPALSVGGHDLTGRILRGGGLGDGLAVVWLGAVIATELTVGQWTRTYVVLATFAVALTLLTRAVRLWLRRLGPVAARGLAPAVVSTAAVAWVTFPIWCAPVLAGPRAEAALGYLVPLHPSLSLNGVLVEQLGAWSERPLAYRWTSLNQDVAYRLPESILPAAVFHLAMALGAWLLTPHRKAV